MQKIKLFSEEEILESLLTSMNQITEYIYLGNQTAAGYSPAFEDPNIIADNLQKSKQNLINLGIKNILCCADNNKFFSDDFCYKSLYLKDKPGFPIKDYFHEAYEFINDNIERNEKTLVHCNAGVTRSASIVISYLMKKLNKSFDEIYLFVQSKRPCINVKVFEEDLRSFNSL